jgi:hypothetical protein
MSIIKKILIVFFLGLSIFYLKNHVYSLLIISSLAIVLIAIPKKSKTLNGMIMGISSISRNKSIIRLKIDETRTFKKIIIPNSILDKIVIHENISVEISHLGNFIRVI